MALLTRYAKRIALAYDVDAAGEKAGTFGATALEEVIRQLAGDESGVELDDVRVVRLPEGRDPDEVMRDEPDRWREEVRTARPIVDHLIDVHARAHDLRTPGGQARFVDAVLPIIRNLPNPVLRDAYLGRVRQVSGVEERTLLEAMHRRDGRPGDGRDGRARAGGDRFTAAAVTQAAGRAPGDRDPARASRGRSRSCCASCCWCPRPHDDGAGRARPGPAAVAGGPRAVPGDRAGPRARTTQGVRPAFSLRGRSSTASTTRAAPWARR